MGRGESEKPFGRRGEWSPEPHPVRRIAPIALTLAAVVGGFVVYLHYQPRLISANPNNALPPPPVIPDHPGGAVIGPGSAAWVRERDPTTGELQYQFKTDFYDPQKDGTVLVTNPVMEFFLSNGQVLHIEGKNGVVRMTPGEDRNLFAAGSGEPPRYGKLDDVKVILYETVKAQRENPNSPYLTAHMTNAQFDNDTYSLFTREYTDANGQTVHADDVPVTLTSKDYAFDGTGLTMYWNDLNHKLKSLEIAHGKKLTIFNAGQFSGGTVVKKSESSDAHAPANPAPAADGPPAKEQPQTPASEVIVAAAPANPAPSTKPADQYLATFAKNVRIVQAGKELSSGQELSVRFAPKNPETKPTTQPVATPAPARSTEIVPATNPAPESTPSVAAAAPTPAAPTPASEQPIEVYWDGKLKLVPQDPTIELVPAGQSIVEMTGSPVQVHPPAENNQPVTDITCGGLTVRSADSSTLLVGNDSSPVLLTQTRADGGQSVVKTPKLFFSNSEKYALLEGKGHASSPDPNDPKSILNAEWLKSCKVNFVNDAKGQAQITSADLNGNVIVDHPRFTLSSADLSLTFDPASSSTAAKSGSPLLREIVATGDANCLVHNSDQHSDSIAGQKLDLNTAPGPDGKLYPNLITADGSARAIQDDQDISAEHLKMWLKPSDKAQAAQNAAMGQVDLQRLEATDSVSGIGKDNSSLAGDYLLVVRENDHSDITIKGKPDHPAVVTGKDSKLTAPEIHINSLEQTSSVQGAGALMATPQPSESNPHPQPINLHWQQQAQMDAKKNLIQIMGGVNADSTGSDGTVFSASSDHLTATMSDAAATQPAAKKTAAPQEFDFLQGKQISAVALLDNALMQAKKTDVNGNLLNFVKLTAERIDCDTASKNLIVPQKGMLHMEQHLAPNNGPAPAAAANSQAFGTTSMAWSKRFEFNQDKSVAVFTGDVVVVHQDDSAAPKYMSLEGDQVTVEFIPTKHNQAGGAMDLDASGSVKLMAATGAVRVSSGDLILDQCDKVEFDPIKHSLTCTNGRLTDSNLYRNGATFDSVTIDTLTNTLAKSTNLGLRAGQ